MLKLLIIIPAYNEASNIERVVDNLIENYSQYDYVIVMMDQAMTQERYVQTGNIISWIYLLMWD